MSYSKKQRQYVADMAEALGLGHYPYANSTGPKAFDCSGLIVAAWKQAGLTLPHNSEQMAAHTKLSPFTSANIAKLLPGDLVYYYGKKPSNVTHVAIFLRKWTAVGPEMYLVAQATDTYHGSELIRWDKYVKPTGLGFIR